MKAICCCNKNCTVSATVVWVSPQNYSYWNLNSRFTKKVVFFFFFISQRWCHRQRAIWIHTKKIIMFVACVANKRTLTEQEEDSNSEMWTLHAHVEPGSYDQFQGGHPRWGGWSRSPLLFIITVSILKLLPWIPKLHSAHARVQVDVCAKSEEILGEICLLLSILNVTSRSFEPQNEISINLRCN